MVSLLYEDGSFFPIHECIQIKKAPEGAFSYIVCFVYLSPILVNGRALAPVYIWRGLPIGSLFSRISFH